MIIVFLKKLVCIVSYHIANLILLQTGDTRLKMEKHTEGWMLDHPPGFTIIVLPTIVSRNLGSHSEAGY